MQPLGPPSDETRQDWQAAGKATALGCSVAVSLLLCIIAGVLLDRWLGTRPIFVLVGVVLGLVLSGYSLYELATVTAPKRKVSATRPRGTASTDAAGDEWGDVG